MRQGDCAANANSMVVQGLMEIPSRSSVEIWASSKMTVCVFHWPPCSSFYIMHTMIKVEYLDRLAVVLALLSGPGLQVTAVM